MRELTLEEIGHVNGGWNFLTDRTQVGMATRFARSVGLLGTSFTVGYAFGTWLYDNGVGGAWRRYLDSREAH
ncbi:MAG: hypothetical protein H0W33_02785 [Gammaproteobacteria bacterium]|nr:hypothetical protein [Gammaproteobacteria bacterium]